MTTLSINHENYEEAISKTGMTFVKVSSPTCGPCKLMATIFEKLSKENSEHTFAEFEVNSTGDESLAIKLGVSSVPAFLVYKDGELDKQFVGAFPLSVLKTKLGI